MSEEKKPVVRKPVDMTPAVNTGLFKELGVVALNRSFDLVESMIEAGKTDLMQGYASSLMASDLMHSAGLLSDQAYGSIFVMENIMEGIAGLGSLIGSVFGAASPFAPSLKTWIENRGTASAGRTAASGIQDVLRTANELGVSEVALPGGGTARFREPKEEEEREIPPDEGGIPQS